MLRKNPFDRMKEGATVSNTFTIGQVVWQEWQVHTDTLHTCMYIVM